MSYIDKLLKIESFTKVTDQTKINIGGEFGILEVQAIRGKLTDQLKAITDLSTQLVILKEELLREKTDVERRINDAVSKAIVETNEKWQIKLTSANQTIQALSEQNLANLPYQTLFSWAWKNFWNRKKE